MRSEGTGSGSKWFRVLVTLTTLTGLLAGLIVVPVAPPAAAQIDRSTEDQIAWWHLWVPKMEGAPADLDDWMHVGWVEAIYLGEGITRIRFTQSFDTGGREHHCYDRFGGGDVSKQPDGVHDMVVNVVDERLSVVGLGGSVPVLTRDRVNPRREVVTTHVHGRAVPDSRGLESEDYLWVDLLHEDGVRPDPSDLILPNDGSDLPTTVVVQVNLHAHYHENFEHLRHVGTCAPGYRRHASNFFRSDTAEAAFRAEETEVPGEFEYIPADTSDDREWFFGDGNGSTETSPTHQYELPGTYTVTMCVDGDDCHEARLVVEPPSLEGEIELIPDDPADGSDHFALGEEFTVRLTVEAGRGLGDLIVSGAPPLEVAIKDSEFLGLADGSAASDEEQPDDADNEFPEELILESEESAVFDYRVVGIAGGEFELVTEFVAEDAAGEEVGPVEVAVEVRLGGLEVEFILPEDQIELEERTEGEVGADGLLLEAGFEPEEFEVTVRVTVPEGMPPMHELQLFSVSPADGLLDIDAVSLVRSEWRELLHQPIPMPTRIVTDPDPLVYAGPVQPGEHRDFEFTLEAETPGAFQLRAFVEAVPEGGGVVRAMGKDVVVIAGPPVLSVQLAANPEHGTPPRIDEGQLVNFSGVVENLTLDQMIRLDPLSIVSEGQGLVLGPVELGEELPLPGDLGVFEVELEPGESAQFSVSVATQILEGVNSNYLRRNPVRLRAQPSGKVIDAEGEERDLDPDTEVMYEIGNGRVGTPGRLMAEVNVSAVPSPVPTYEFSVWAPVFGGLAIQRGFQGAGQWFVQIPELLAALPGIAWHLGEGSIRLSMEEAETMKVSVQYFWAWLEYQRRLFHDLNTETIEWLIDEISADLYARKHHRVDQINEIREVVVGAITGLRDAVYQHEADIHQASSYGFTWGLAELMADTFLVVGEVGMDVLTGVALYMWFGRTARSSQVAEELAEAAARRADDGSAAVARATDEVWNAASDPRVTQAPASMRTLERSAPVSPQQAVRGWAIDLLSDTNLRRLTSPPDGLPIMVAIRSRADETIEWMATSLGITVKPVGMKPKNVDWRDVQFLGYRDGVGYGVGDRGAMALSEPLERAEVLRRLDAAGADDFTRSTVLDRHNTRWEEWFGVECPGSAANCVRPDNIDSDMSKLFAATSGVVEVGADGMAIRKGTMNVPRRGRAPEPQDNWDTSWAKPKYDPRQVELRQIPDPEGLGRPYYEIWLEAADGSMRRVSGDIDIVAVTDNSGRVLRGSSAENAAQQLGHAIDAQHPWSATLSDPRLRKKFLDAHRWHPDPAQRGEPLLIYVNGEARVGWFDPTKAINPNSPLDSVLWLDGGTGQVDSVVRVQRDLRSGMPSPAHAPDPVGHTPGTATVRKALLEADLRDGAGRVAACAITSGTRGAIYRLGPGGGLEKREADGTFDAADVNQECEDGEIVVLPDTATLEAVAAGDRVIPIIDDLLEWDWRSLFTIGSCLLFAPGEPTEEEACIEDYGSLVLDRPLQFDHPELTMIVLLSGPDPDVVGPEAVGAEEAGSAGAVPVIAGLVVLLLGGAVLVFIRVRRKEPQPEAPPQGVADL